MNVDDWLDAVESLVERLRECAKADRHAGRSNLPHWREIGARAVVAADYMDEAADALDVLVAGWRKVLALCDGEDDWADRVNRRNPPRPHYAAIKPERIRVALVEALRGPSELPNALPRQSFHDSPGPTPTPTAEETR